MQEIKVTVNETVKAGDRVLMETLLGLAVIQTNPPAYMVAQKDANAGESVVFRLESERDALPTGTVRISAKCSDLFYAEYRGKEYAGYVPPWIPGEHRDYVQLEIDIATGQILNWVRPTQAQFDDTFNKKK